MAKPFTSYDYDDASNLVGRKTRVADTYTISSNPRRPPSAIAASDFFAGDHWQNGKGFMGQMPPIGFPGKAQIEADIKLRFDSENVIKEVIETHRDGALGREPLWSFLPKEGERDPSNKKSFENVTGETLTPWWNEREILEDFQKTLDTVLLEGIVVRRIFFPRGLVPESGKLTASNLPDALRFIYSETLTADVAGVFTDQDTQKQIGIFLFEEKNQRGDVTANCAELSFLNDAGDTVCRVVKDKGQPQDYGPYRLGGRLLIHELKRSQLITEQVQANQKGLNLAKTMMLRNVNMAGSRERTITNAQPPMKPKRIQDPTRPTKTKELEPGPYEHGAGAVMFLMGYPIWNEKGDIVGYTNPGIDVTDPAAVEVFIQTRNSEYESILGQCHQRHILISGDAAASAVSRKQAEKGWQRSLKESKTVLDAAGRWQLETTLRLAAQLINQSGKYLPLRADFNCLLDVGEPDPDDIRITMEMRKPGGPKNEPLISDETARQRVGIEDPAAELAKIEEEAPTDAEIRKRVELMTPPAKLNGESKVIQ